MGGNVLNLSEESLALWVRILWICSNGGVHTRASSGLKEVRYTRLSRSLGLAL